MIPSYYEFQNSSKILSGKNALDNIPFEMKNLGAKRPIILASNRLLKEEQVKNLIDSFNQWEIQVGAYFVEIPPDSSIEVVNKIAGVYRENKCDSIIALGGGKVLDTAKGLNVVISQNTDDLSEFMGSEIITKKGVPFIMVPTTAGTGSEATCVAVISDTSKNVKMEFLSYNLLPDVAVLDPRMFLSLPQKLTASTGMDALTHAIEAYTCNQKNPLSDAYAFSAIKLISEYLPKAVENGKDEEARLAMANASLMAGASFSNSMVGIVHAIGHAAGGVCHVAHSDAMGILLPYCMEYNMDKMGELYGELVLPLCGEEIFASTEKSIRGKKAVDTVKNMLYKFNKICGLPLKLSEVGVKEEHIMQIAKTALNDGAIIMNPKTASLDDIIDIIKKAL